LPSSRIAMRSLDAGSIRRAVSFLRQKQILHKLGVVVSITVIGIACYVLYHMLAARFNEVIEAISRHRAAPRYGWRAVRAAGYFTLTFYDLFAVRAIGTRTHSLPHQRARSLLLLFIGHNAAQRLHRRRGAYGSIRPGAERDRKSGKKILFPGRADMLARQCRRCWEWHAWHPKPPPRRVSCRPGSNRVARSRYM